MFGPLERFIGILIEHKRANCLLAVTGPGVVMTSDRQEKYCWNLRKTFRNHGFGRNGLEDEMYAFKIPIYIKRVPFRLVAGDREVEGRTWPYARAVEVLR